MAKNLILWLIIAAVLMSVFQNLAPPQEDNTVNYTQFVQEVHP